MGVHTTSRVIRSSVEAPAAQDIVVCGFRAVWTGRKGTCQGRTSKRTFTLKLADAPTLWQVNV